jgi:hypothetical protein
MLSNRAAVEPMPGAYCVICLRGHLAPRWSEWFGGLTLTHTKDGQTVLAGPIADQAALHGLLGKMLDLNVTLISVACRDLTPVASDGL